MKTGSAALVSEQPQSLFSLKSIEKALQIKDFAKRNWTPIVIRIVSKLVSSYGGELGIRTLGPFRDTAFRVLHLRPLGQLSVY